MINPFPLIKKFRKDMFEKGYVVFENFVPQELVERLIEGTESAYTHCRKIQTEKGLSNTEGTVHHLVFQGESFADYLDLFEDLNAYAEAYFGGKYILNAFGGNILSKGMSYASNTHRDIRSFSDNIPLMLNTIVMLDDFTRDNGATWLMHGGHKWGNKPSEEEFMDDAFQILGKAGDVVFFNSNMWHRAGENRTDSPRRSLTPMFTKPFYKPQFNYTQFCNEDSSEWTKQLLGYYSRIPDSLNDWYQQPNERFYRSNQQ